MFSEIPSVSSSSAQATDWIECVFVSKTAKNLWYRQLIQAMKP